MYAPYTPLASHRDGGRPAIETVPMVDDVEVARAARNDACVLFTGPFHVRTLALRIHSLSGWRWGSFLAVDCGAEAAVLEHQLFRVLESEQIPPSAEATARLLQPGSLFLHEVGRLSLASQRRLRDLLSDPAPGQRLRRVRRRIMASTSEPLLPRVDSGTFDDQLYYRLNVIHFVLPDSAHAR